MGYNLYLKKVLSRVKVVKQTMAESRPEIKKILDAEKEASNIILAARKRKIMRLQQAKDQAKQEIERRKQDIEKNLHEISTEYDDNLSAERRMIEERNDKELARIEQRVSEKKDEVVEMLLKGVWNVEPSMHKNYVK